MVSSWKIVLWMGRLLISGDVKMEHFVAFYAGRKATLDPPDYSRDINGRGSIAGTSANSQGNFAFKIEKFLTLAFCALN